MSKWISLQRFVAFMRGGYLLLNTGRPWQGLNVVTGATAQTQERVLRLLSALPWHQASFAGGFSVVTAEQWHQFHQRTAKKYTWGGKAVKNMLGFGMFLKEGVNSALADHVHITSDDINTMNELLMHFDEIVSYPNIKEKFANGGLKEERSAFLTFLAQHCPSEGWASVEPLFLSESWCKAVLQSLSFDNQARFIHLARAAGAPYYSDEVKGDWSLWVDHVHQLNTIWHECAFEIDDLVRKSKVEHAVLVVPSSANVYKRSVISLFTKRVVVQLHEWINSEEAQKRAWEYVRGYLPIVIAAQDCVAFSIWRKVLFKNWVLDVSMFICVDNKDAFKAVSRLQNSDFRTLDVGVSPNLLAPCLIDKIHTDEKGQPLSYIQKTFMPM